MIGLTKNTLTTATERAHQLRAQIEQSVRQYHELTAGAESRHNRSGFKMPSGAVLDADDRAEAVLAALDLEITSGAAVTRFERAIARAMGARSGVACNSGSSANLLAFAALCDPMLDGHITPGSEVITSAVGFPTTVAPIIQHGCIPVFVDVDPSTGNIDVGQLEEAVSPRTRAVALAHTLGNPFRADLVREFADQHNLWLLEDNCDALGAEVGGCPTGSFGHVSTVSFYPAHHITCGEGGCVGTDSVQIAAILRSLRDWGRDCWCAPGEDDRCFNRFGKQSGCLPDGFDHKYVFSRAGYNLKMSDLQARIGLSQLTRLPDFGAARRHNWATIHSQLSDCAPISTFVADDSVTPSWFGYAFTLDPNAALGRRELQVELERRGIGSRVVFAGSLVAQPMMKGRDFRIIGDLPHAATVTAQSLWVGVYPGLTESDCNYIGGTIRELVTLP